MLDGGPYRRAVRSGRLVREAMFRAVVEDGVIWADGRHERIDVLLFATGFRPRMPWLARLGVLDAEGCPRQRNGVALDLPGLYFVGLSRQRNFASATLRGVGPDAAYVTDLIVRGAPAAIRVGRGSVA
ncbi:hypothetical protein [Chitinimonas koreensis]|uniref:hypothetical protein n=1 Tax=Chitinimonas koreensis TaxID=356302 RepID=UPI00146F9B69|nr:hypothetical protein [Chitinimonas koreensis]QNM96897.1 hypothetical protein H9L41_00650 [Chitinimonas koreensis]